MLDGGVSLLRLSPRPSGNVLESASDRGPRGMIAALRRPKERSRKRAQWTRSAQNPAYRLIRQFCSAYRWITFLIPTAARLLQVP